MLECYIYLSKDCFANKGDFTFENTEVSVDVTTGTIYAYHQLLCRRPNTLHDKNYHIIGPLDYDKILTLSWLNDNGDVDYLTIKEINERNKKYCFSDVEFVTAQQALETYLNNRVLSIYWPGEKYTSDATNRPAAQVGLQFLAGSPGAYTDALAPVTPDRPPEVLLTPEQAAKRQADATELFMRFHGGRAVKPEDSSLITTAQAAKSRSLSASGQIRYWQRKYPEETPGARQKHFSVFSAPKALRNPFEH